MRDERLLDFPETSLEFTFMRSLTLFWYMNKRKASELRHAKITLLELAQTPNPRRLIRIKLLFHMNMSLSGRK